MNCEQNQNKKTLKLNRLRSFGIKYKNYQLVKLVDELSSLQKEKEELENIIKTLCSNDKVAETQSCKVQLQLLNEEIQVIIAKIEQEESNTKKPKTVWVWNGNVITSSLSKKQRRKLRQKRTTDNKANSKSRYNGTLNDYSKAIHGPTYRANYKRGKTVMK